MSRIPHFVRPAALAVALSLVGASGFAADSQTEEIKALKEQLQVIMKRLEDLSSKQQESAQKTQNIEKKVEKVEAQTTSSQKASEPLFDKFISGFYGTLDVSVDDVTKGMGGLTAYHYSTSLVNGNYAQGAAKGAYTPLGNMNYLPQIGTNKSQIGYRGNFAIDESGTKFLYQVEASLALTAQPGLKTSYTSQSNTVNGTLGSGDTFVGFAGDSWGSVKFGTTYAPYKKSTDRLNPFSGMLGDYSVIMGNSGGDNRVEFGTRLEHSVWYESPKIYNTTLSVLLSPGQNRSVDSVVQSAGSSDCNGGNMPGSGNLPGNCDDGGFSNAASMALTFDTPKFYATLAGEIHQGVNRNSDGIGAFIPSWVSPSVLDTNPIYQPCYGTTCQTSGSGPGATVYDYNPFSAAGGTPPYINDVGNEWAVKLGAQYKFDFGLAVNGIFERMRRNIPAYLQFQNERSRDGWWLALTQEITPTSEVSVGWGRAQRTPGDPGGQHNYNPNSTDNTADMYTIAYKRKVAKNLTWYADAAMTINHGNAHYDLGAGGRSIPVDCHDGTNSVAAGSIITDSSSNGPTTWGGCRLVGFSTGINYKF